MEKRRMRNKSARGIAVKTGMKEKRYKKAP